jgi:hypothetical protein
MPAVIVLPIVLGLFGLAVGFAIMFAVIAIVGGGIGVAVYAFYLHNKKPEPKQPLVIPNLEYWALGIGGALVLLILIVEARWGLSVGSHNKGVEYSGAHTLGYFAWYVFGHVVFILGAMGAFGWLYEQPTWLTPDPNKLIQYYVCYVAIVVGIVWSFVQWPRISVFLAVFVGAPWVVLQGVKHEKQVAVVTEKEAAKRAALDAEESAKQAIVTAEAALAQNFAQQVTGLSEETFVRNVLR